jgi:hypothetical protein
MVYSQLTYKRLLYLSCIYCSPIPLDLWQELLLQGIVDLYWYTIHLIFEHYGVYI